MLGLLLHCLPLVAAEPVSGVAMVQPFALEQPYRYRWHADGRAVSEGLLLVLAVDAEVARPRQGPQPVLYVGDTPAERLSWSATAPWLVVLVPGPVDLARTPVYWGDETLPEQVDAAHGAAQLDLARAAGLAPLPPMAPAPMLRVTDVGALHQAVAPLVARWAPLPQP